MLLFYIEASRQSALYRFLPSLNPWSEGASLSMVLRRHLRLLLERDVVVLEGVPCIPSRELAYVLSRPESICVLKPKLKCQAHRIGLDMAHYLLPPHPTH